METNGTKWKDCPWSKENLPLWKRILKLPARIIMILGYYGLIVGAFVVIHLEGDQLNSPAIIIFFGTYLPMSVVIIIYGIILFGFGIIGSIVCTVMLVRYFMKKPFKLTWKPKVGVVVVAVIAIISVQYYEPFWPVAAGFTQPAYGPYIAIYDQNTMEVSWDTPTAMASTLEWGNTSTTYSSYSQIAHAMYNSTQTISEHHMVLIPGLVPGNTYYYTIPGFDNNVYKFEMAPASNTQDNVTFTIVGDTHGNFNICQQNVAVMRKVAPDLDFTMIAGDLTSYDDDNYEWAALFASASYGGLATEIPWMNVCGNHETYNDNPNSAYRGGYKTYFEYNYANNRTIQPGLSDYGLYYSFNYSDVHVCVMDCMENGSGYFSSAQIQWLIQDLQNNANMWKFVSFHYPMYSTGSPTSLTDMDAILEPIFAQYHVDGVFWGHAHDFESFYNSTLNTYYFTLGGGGGVIDPLASASAAPYQWPGESMRVNETHGEFAMSMDRNIRFMGNYAISSWTFRSKEIQLARLQLTDLMVR